MALPPTDIFCAGSVFIIPINSYKSVTIQVDILTDGGQALARTPEDAIYIALHQCQDAPAVVSSARFRLPQGEAGRTFVQSRMPLYLVDGSRRRSSPTPDGAEFTSGGDCRCVFGPSSQLQATTTVTDRNPGAIVSVIGVDRMSVQGANLVPGLHAV